MLGPELASRLRALASEGLDPSAIARGILEPISGRTLRDDATVMVIRHEPAAAT